MGIAVKRVGHIDVEEFRRDYADRGRPVILSGCIDHWPARRKWNLDYFATRFGDKPLRFSERQWTIGEFIDALRSGRRPAPYLNQVKLDEQFPEIKVDVGDLKYTRANALESPFLPRSMRIPLGIKALFIGGAGSGFGKLHWDTGYLHVYISQVFGRKNFLIYSPDDSPYLYPRPDLPCDSSIPDINDYDEASYPDMKKATPIRFTLEPGETVFIPGGWWHATQMAEPSISLAESALDRGNWRIRRDWFMESFRVTGVPLHRRLALGSYLRAMGLFVR